jgi:hypothetical protein
MGKGGGNVNGRLGRGARVSGHREVEGRRGENNANTHALVVSYTRATHKHSLRQPPSNTHNTQYTQLSHLIPLFTFCHRQTGNETNREAHM